MGASCLGLGVDTAPGRELASAEDVEKAVAGKKPETLNVGSIAAISCSRDSLLTPGGLEATTAQLLLTAGRSGGGAPVWTS